MEESLRSCYWFLVSKRGVHLRHSFKLSVNVGCKYYDLYELAHDSSTIEFLTKFSVNTTIVWPQPVVFVARSNFAIQYFIVANQRAYSLKSRFKFGFNISWAETFQIKYCTKIQWDRLLWKFKKTKQRVFMGSSLTFSSIFVEVQTWVNFPQ